MAELLLENNLTNDVSLEKKQNNFLQSNVGKAINTGLNIGLRYVLPDLIEDDVIENYDKAEREAYKFLYNKCKKDFLKIFNDFTDKTMSFYNIDKVFQQSFIENLFIPMLKNFEPDNDSLGLRVKNLIKSDLSHCASLLYENNIQNEYFSRLIRASSTYILSLEEIQKTMIFF